jgi:hypothetical protein
VRVIEKPHLTPQCPGIGEADEPARARIVSQAMMGGGAFILLKAGSGGPKTAKQAEIRLAVLLKILRNYPSPGPVSPRQGWTGRAKVVFSTNSLGMANLAGIIAFVIQITVLAPKAAQYPAREHREKITPV